jgi:hypothetical protein
VVHSSSSHGKDTRPRRTLGNLDIRYSRVRLRRWLSSNAINEPQRTEANTVGENVTGYWNRRYCNLMTFYDPHCNPVVSFCIARTMLREASRSIGCQRLSSRIA